MQHPPRICDALIQAASHQANSTAVVYANRRHTYAELQDRVARLASILHAHGLEPNQRAAMLSRNSDRYLEFYFAAIWAGGVMVPLNHRLTLAELTHVFRDSAPSVLLYDDDHRDMAHELWRLDPSLELIDVGEAPPHLLSYEDLVNRAEPMADRSGSGDDLALIVYTGGTTDKPRGVMLTHRNIVSNSRNTIPYLKLDQSTIQLHVGPLFHLGAGQRIYSVTEAGGRHILLEKFSVDAVLETIERERVTSVVLVPTMMHRILNHPHLERFDLRSLRYVSYGAAPMPPTLLASFMLRFDHCEVCQSYGQTECSPVATSLEYRDHLIDGPYGNRRGTVGRAVPSVHIDIVDLMGNPLPPNTVGEITVRGPNVMKGYWNNPDATAKALRKGRLHTGDLGSMDEHGFVTLIDRIKDMVISGGENVYCLEVENILTQHVDVLAAAVIGVPDADLGERVHAIVYHTSPIPLESQSIDAHCRQYLAGYKVPRSIDFTTQPLPLTSANKIDKRALKARYS